MRAYNQHDMLLRGIDPNCCANLLIHYIYGTYTIICLNESFLKNKRAQNSPVLCLP